MIVRLYPLLLYALCVCTLVAQELPPVVNFTPEAYGADNQNWMVSQAKEGTIYVANNAGLLEFNGAKWTLYPSPNETIIRSVNVINDTIYTGAYMDFGFWTKTKKSNLVYTSLNQQKNIDVIEDEQFWNIIHHQKWLFFQSLDRILILNKATGNISSIEADHTISKIYKLNNEIYFQVVSEGIFSIRNGRKELVSDHELAKTNRFIAAFIIDDALTFISEKNGFFKLNGKEILPWKTASDFALQSIAIYSGIQMGDASILLGTITHGVYHISKTGKILYNLDQTNGLDNNTALTLFEDQRKNIWVGLDNGLDCINTNAPLQNYVDHTGRLGTTYASQSFGGNLYLGTNQGLFYRPLDQSVDFILIEGTEGPVWNLKVIDDTLFCGHNLGTFIVEEGKAQLVATIQGTWDIKKIPTHPNLLLQGNYTGLYTLSKESGAWKIKSKLKGFDISCKHFEITDDLTIFVSHEYKGVFQLQANEAFDKIENYHTIKTLSKGIHSSLVAFNNRIFYANKKGIFEYDPVKKSFAKVEELSEMFNGNEFSSGKLVVSNDILWAFTKSHIWQIEVEKIDASYRTKKLSIPQILREEMEGYENLSYLDESNYILGKSNGYLLINPEIESPEEFEIRIDEVQITTGTGMTEKCSLTQDAPVFDSSTKGITIDYSVPEFEKFLITEYHYILEGSDNNWTTWNRNTSISFTNLAHGEYNFKVRAKINNTLTRNTASYQFSIGKPWYLSTTFLFLYCLGGLLFFVLVHWFYKRYYRKQRERILEKTTKDLKIKELAAQKEIVELKNERLNQDIEARNRELAIATMNMISKNTTLNNIKNEIISQGNLKELTSVIKLLDDTINSKKEWKFFEEAFNHADQDFFKKVTHLHPQLTPNDLRLCVYLRLNLSSKEIAPLLNISPRSVEIKRYRLRKKIGLEREINLNEYFIRL